MPRAALRAEPETARVYGVGIYATACAFVAAPTAATTHTCCCVCAMRTYASTHSVGTLLRCGYKQARAAPKCARYHVCRAIVIYAANHVAMPMAYQLAHHTRLWRTYVRHAPPLPPRIRRVRASRCSRWFTLRHIHTREPPSARRATTEPNHGVTRHVATR